MPSSILDSLDDDVLSVIVLAIKQDHNSDSKPRKAGIQSLLDHSPVNPLSLVCKRIRRIALPVLFDSIWVTFGFLAVSTRRHLIEDEEVFRTLRSLLSNQCYLDMVKNIIITGYQGNFTPFLVGALESCRNLVTVEIPLSLSNNPEVLEAIRTHPSLTSAFLPSFVWPSTMPGQHLTGTLDRMVWRDVALGDDASQDVLRTYLDRGITVKCLSGIMLTGFWEELIFKGLEELSATVTAATLNIARFMARHPTLERISVSVGRLEGDCVQLLCRDIPCLQHVADVTECAKILNVKFPDLSLARSSASKFQPALQDWVVDSATVFVTLSDVTALKDGGIRAMGLSLPHLKNLNITLEFLDDARNVDLDQVATAFAGGFPSLRDLTFGGSMANLMFGGSMINLIVNSFIQRTANDEPDYHVDKRNLVREFLKFSYSLASSIPCLDIIIFPNVPIQPRSRSHALGWQYMQVIVQRNPATGLKVFEGGIEMDDETITGIKYVMLEESWPLEG